MKQDFNVEELVSGSTGPIKWVLVMLPLLSGGFAVAEAVRAYWFPDGFDRANGALWFFAMFVASGSFSVFLLSRLMDEVYAQVGLLSLEKRGRPFTVPYGDIEAIGVFRGMYGRLAWLRIRGAPGRKRLVFFMACDDYATSWPSRTATRFLWKKLSEPVD